MGKKICVVTASRADYGLLCWVMMEIEKRPELDLIPVVTGTHLSDKFGYTIKEIENDGFANLKTIRLSDDSSPYGIAKTISKIVEEFATFFSKIEIDMLILLGDRFEMLAIGLAALPYNIPLAHIGGGEISEGVIDENVRHCLTKLSHLHFVITKDCANRIKQLSEEPWRIKVVGSPRLDSKNKIKFKTKTELGEQIGLSFKDKVMLVVYHPETLEIKNTKTHIDNLLKAIKTINIATVLFYPNLDANSDIIIKELQKCSENNRNVKLMKPLSRDDYFSLLNAVDILVGNSSIGFIEAPSFSLPAVNIGNRQKGRDHVQNIITVENSYKSIIGGIEKGLYDEDFIKSLKSIVNPYGDGNASKRIVDILSNIDFAKFSIVKTSCFK